jgi:hypothetical protein
MNPISDQAILPIMFTMITKPRLVQALRRLARLAIVLSVALSAKRETDFVGNAVQNTSYKRTENVDALA